MKKGILVILLVVAGFQVRSQIPGFSIGPKVGYNSNRLTTDFDSIRSDATGSMQLGAFVRIGKKIYFQPEANYVVKGGKLDIEGIGVQRILLKSVTIPILIGYRPINTGLFNVRFMAGPTMSFILEKSLNTPEGFVESFPIKSPEDLKHTIWSLQMGAGIDIDIFTIDVRYELGVDNIYEGNLDFTTRNNLFNVSLGIKLL